MMERLRLLRDYFPLAVFNGRALVFISEEFRIEVTEHAQRAFGPAGQDSVIRVRIFQRTDTGEYAPGHIEEFCLADIAELAGELEKYIQNAVGRNLKE